VNIKANGCRYRYSNTLLVSLNNRISIREVSLGRGALLTSGIRPTSMAKDGPSIVHLEIEKPPCAFGERKQSVESVEDDGREGVIGKWCGASFPVFFQHLDLINSYRVIWILNRRTSWTTITMTGLIIYFCTVTCESCFLGDTRTACTLQDGDNFISCTF
jgi:hypothetical protein